MKSLVIVAVLAGLFAVGFSAPNCDAKAVNQTMMTCFSDNGIDPAKIMKLTPQNGQFKIDASFYKDLCAERYKYKKALACMTVEFDRCFSEDSAFMPDIEKTTHLMDMMCNDPNLDFSCMTEVSQHVQEISDCVTAKINMDVELKTKTMQEVVCESSRAGTQCAVDLMKNCDAYTAKAFEKYQQYALPKECNVDTQS